MLITSLPQHGACLDSPDTSGQSAAPEGGLRGQLRRPWPGAVVLTVRGEVDPATAEKFADWLTMALQQAPAVVVDLTRLDFLDAAGMSALVRAQRQARHRGIRLTLATHPARSVTRALTLGGLHQLLPLAPTVDAACVPHTMSATHPPGAHRQASKPTRSTTTCPSRHASHVRHV